MKPLAFRTGLLLASALSAVGVAHAAPPPDIQVFVDGGFIGNVSWTNDLLVPGGYTTTQTFLSGGNVRIGEAFLAPVANAYGTGWDFSYGLGFVTTDVASTLKVVFDLPALASPLTSPATGASSLVGTLLAPTSNGASITPTSGGTVQTVSLAPTDVTGLSGGASFAITGPAGTSQQYSGYTATNVLPSFSSGLTGMLVVAEFALGSHSAATSLDGNVLITPVPESQALAMMLAGFGVLGFLARRRDAA